MPSLKEKTLSSLLWKLLERWGNQAVALIVQIVLARLLTPEDFGLLAVLIVFINIGGIIVQSGLSTALIQSKNISQRDYSTVFTLSLCISFLMYAVLFFAAPYIALFYNNQILTSSIRVLSLVLVINAANGVLSAYVQRDLEFKKVFITSLISVVISGVIGIVAALCSLGIWALVIQQLISAIVGCITLSIQIKWFPKLGFAFSSAKRLFGFGWKLLVSGLLDTIYQSLSDLIIGKQFGTSELGAVSQGKKYPNAISSMLDGAIQPVMLAATSRIQESVEDVKGFVRRALKTSTFLIFPSMALFALVAQPLIVLLLGEKWLVAVPFMQMYCFIYAFYPVHSTNLQALNGMGRSDLFLRLEFIKKGYGIIVLVFTAFVLKDIYAIVIGYMCTTILSTFVNASPNKKVIGYSYLEQVRDIAPAIGLTALSAIITWPLSLINMPSILLLIAQCVVFMGVYIVASLLFKVEEADYIIKTCKELFAKKRGIE